MSTRKHRRFGLINFFRSFSGLLLIFALPQLGHALDDTSRQSPQFTEYNTNIEGQNFLELLASGSQPLSVRVSFFKIDGTFQKAVRVDLDPKEQVDLDVNTLVGTVNTYGVVKIEFNNTSLNHRLQGRMAVYRLNEGGQSFSFAYVLPLRVPITGASFATSNTFDPQGRRFVVPNWLSVTNLAVTAQEFTHNLYNQAGALVTSTVFTLNPNQRRDLAAGDFETEQVYLNEVVPTVAATGYISSIIRYASNTRPGGRFNTYSFAMPVFARAGSGSDQFMPISNQEADCFTQTNWVEVVNVTTGTVNANLEFRDRRGLLFATTSRAFSGRSQFHYNASVLLEDRDSDAGIVKVNADVANSLITQSVVYYHDCASNLLQTAYNLQGNTGTESPLVGSYNRFLAQDNELRVYGIRGITRNVELSLNSGGTEIHSSVFDLDNFATVIFQLNDTIFGTTPDTYGTISLDTVSDESMMAFNLRLRKIGARRQEVDFAMPIEVR